MLKKLKDKNILFKIEIVMSIIVLYFGFYDNFDGQFKTIFSATAAIILASTTTHIVRVSLYLSTQKNKH